MTLEQLVAECRSRLDDEAAPYLWSESDLVRYINEAENEACIRARLIYDESSAEFSNAALLADQPTVVLDARILAVDRVRLTSTGRTLERVTRNRLDDQYGGRWENAQGVPRRFFEELGYLRVFPSPTISDELRLSLWRLPSEAMEADEDEPEIAPRFHLQMIDWAIRLAYLKRDADAFDQAKADRHEASFEKSFGPRPDANVQRKRRIKKVPIVRPRW